MPSADLVATVAVAGLLTGMVYGLLALGLSVIFGVMRLVNFAHGEMMTLAMYATVLGCEHFHVDPFVLLIPLTVLFFALGYGLQASVINRFITRPEHSQLLILLSIAIILSNTLLLWFGPDARSIQTDYQLDSFALGSVLVDATRVYAAATSLAVTALLFAFFRLTLTGKAIRACADNYLGARVAGLRIERLYALTFGIGAACVAVAGCMMLLLVEVTPTVGPAYTLLGFVIVIVGGLGSMTGALFGGALIGLSESLASLFIPPSAKSMVSFALLIVVLLLRPQGLFGQKT